MSDTFSARNVAETDAGMMTEGAVHAVKADVHGTQLFDSFSDSSMFSFPCGVICCFRLISHRA